MAIRIPIVSEFNAKGVQRAVKEFQSLDSATSKAAFVFRKALLPAAIATGAAVVGFTKVVMPAVQAASDLEESLSKNRVVFGEAARAIEDFASKAARGLGQSKTEALAAASTFGVFGKAAGLAGEQLATFSTDFVQLASDLASFNNTTPEDAVQALGAALRGESEPLRRYGVLLNDAALKQAAMEMGIYKGNGALTSQQKILAAQKLIFEQTGDAQGDFARTADGLANQQRILAAQIENVKAKLGEVLLPVFTRVVQFLNERFIPAIDLAIDAFGQRGLSGAIGVFVAAFGDGAVKVLRDLQRLSNGFGAFSKFALSALDPIGTALSAITGKDIGIFGGKITALGDRISGTFDNLVAEAERANRILSATPMFTDAQISRYESLGEKVNSATKDFKDLNGVLDDNEDKKTKTGAATKELTERQKKLAEQAKELAGALEQEMGKALDAAKKRVEDAQAAFDDFYQSTRDAAMGALDLDMAFTNAGDNVASGFIDELQEQADRTTVFSDKVRQLLDAGLSAGALRRVISAGVDRGTEIADAILGGAQSVLKVNALVDTIERVADELGMTTAAKFYQAGIDSAQAYLRGVEAAVGAASGVLKGAKTPADVKGASALFGAGMAGAGSLVAPPTYNEYVIYAQSLEPALAGQSIVDALKQFERRNGAIDITVASAFGLVD